MADWDGPTFESETTRALLKQEIARLRAEVAEARELAREYRDSWAMVTSSRGRPLPWEDE
jgi:hypothetical protein